MKERADVTLRAKHCTGEPNRLGALTQRSPGTFGIALLLYLALIIGRSHIFPCKDEDKERLLPHLEPVTLARGAVLYELLQVPVYLYFPTTAMVSLVYTMGNGTTADMDMAGNKGAAGSMRYHRGRLTFLDRPGLEAMVCECYRVVRDEYTRLLG